MTKTILISTKQHFWCSRSKLFIETQVSIPSPVVRAGHGKGTPQALIGSLSDLEVLV